MEEDQGQIAPPPLPLPGSQGQESHVGSNEVPPAGSNPNQVQAQNVNLNLNLKMDASSSSSNPPASQHQQSMPMPMPMSSLQMPHSSNPRSGNERGPPQSQSQNQSSSSPSAYRSSYPQSSTHSQPPSYGQGHVSHPNANPNHGNMHMPASLHPSHGSHGNQPPPPPPQYNSNPGYGQQHGYGSHGYNPNPNPSHGYGNRGGPHGHGGYHHPPQPSHGSVSHQYHGPGSPYHAPSQQTWQGRQGQGPPQGQGHARALSTSTVGTSANVNANAGPSANSVSVSNVVNTPAKQSHGHGSGHHHSMPFNAPMPMIKHEPPAPVSAPVPVPKSAPEATPQQQQIVNVAPAPSGILEVKAEEESVPVPMPVQAPVPEPAPAAIVTTAGKENATNPAPANTNAPGEELPRRVLQFESSPTGGAGACAPKDVATLNNASMAPPRADQNQVTVVLSPAPLVYNDKSMAPLDGRLHHQSQGQIHHRHSQGGQYPEEDRDRRNYSSSNVSAPPPQSYDYYNNNNSGQTQNQNPNQAPPQSQSQSQSSGPTPSDQWRDSHFHGSGGHGHGYAPPPAASPPSYGRSHGSSYHNSNQHPSNAHVHAHQPPPTPHHKEEYHHHNHNSHPNNQHNSHPNQQQQHHSQYGNLQALQPSPAMGLDHIPLMDIGSNGDMNSATKFDDLMVSPPMSGVHGGDKRRQSYDLHDQPMFNESHPQSSPPSLLRNTSATRYCTPIVTGGNDRSRVRGVNTGGGSGKSEQNYRPSPGSGNNERGRASAGADMEYDSHMSHFHRPYPTIRGGQPSPTRYEDGPGSSGRASQKRQHQQQPPKSSDRYRDSPGVYATPVFPRGGSGHPAESSSHSSHGHHSGSQHSSSARGGEGSSRQHHGYYDPHSMPYGHGHGHPPPSAPHMYGHGHPRDPYARHGHPHGHGHGPAHHPPPYGMHGRGHPPPGAPYYSPYDYSHGPPPPVSQPEYHNANQMPEKKRRKMDNSGKPKKSAKPPRRKKMYSDYVGVTYNKTHAKFQACITHYRKQHYLGRYKLAVDAAKAYDQSAKLLKGDGWKINFQSEKEYEMAKEKEFSGVVAKRQASGLDSYSLRKTYEATFPTTEVLREKLGLNAQKPPAGAPAQAPRSAAPAASVSVPVPTQQLQPQQQHPHPHHGPYSQMVSHPTHSQQHMRAPPAMPPSSSYKKEPHAQHQTHHHHFDNTSTMTSVPRAPSHSNLNAAVTPSPHGQNLTKSTNSGTGSMLMNEPLMSPGFIMGNSPSADSILGTGTPFSMPGSTLKIGMSSTIKAQRPMDGAPHSNDLDMVAGNIFSSPKLKAPTSYNNVTVEEKSTGTSASTVEVSKVEEKGEKKKGDLAAASALLMIGN